MGTGRLGRRSRLRLADDLETGTFLVKRPEELCSPAAAAGHEMADPTTHLLAYPIAPLPGAQERVARTIKVMNRLGELSLDLLNADSLLVPTAVATSRAGLLEPHDHDVDAYKCYRARPTPETPLPTDLSVTITDRFAPRRTRLDLRTAVRLCDPVEVNGARIKHRGQWLVCYSVKPAPRATAHANLFARNRFGGGRVQLTKVGELCLPSIIVP